MVSSSDLSTKVLLKDLKNTLPIPVKGKTDQSFSFIDWTMKEEKELAKIQAKNPTMGRFVSAVLCLMLKSIHGEDFAALDEKARILAINQMFLGNVLYMYVYLRYDQLSAEVKFDYTCPFCRTPVKNFTASLDDLDIDTKKVDYQEIIDYRLRKPVTLVKGDQLVEVVKLSMAKWDVMERADTQESTDMASMKEHTFKGSIKGFEGVTGFATDEVVAKLHKIDIELLQKVIAEHNAGPTIVSEIECKKCNNTFYRQIDWSYESFFGVGSLPQA